MWKLNPLLTHRESSHAAVWVLVCGAAIAYTIGVRRFIWRGADAGASYRWRHAAFVAGLLLTLMITASPLSEWSETLFSLHMAQHLGLILICAPLFVMAGVTVTFSRVVAGVFSGFGRRPPRLLLELARGLANPIVVWLVFCGLFVFWHLPGPYIWALQNEAGHAVEHGSFFFSAFAFWAVVMARRTRAPGYGARLAFVSTAALLSGLPGALIALSSRPLYPIHAANAARVGLTPLEDQQLAGLIMWAPMGLVYLIAILALLARWLDEGEARAKRGANAVLLACLCLIMTGCDNLPVNTAKPATSGGDPRAGASLISAVGCGACHTIPGINGAAGLVGPPLDQIGRRIYIAGVLRNTSANLEAWLQDPQEFVPGVVMPNLGLTSTQARDIAAYLATLR